MREVEVPASAAGMRLDRFLATRFSDRSRSFMVRGIHAGQVRFADGARPRPSTTLRGGEVLHLGLPGIAPSGPPPPHPPVMYEDERIVVLDKPAGLLAHPAGSNFSWSVIGLARERWPDCRMDLVHRLDRDTSGAIVLTKEVEANRLLKNALREGRSRKEYLALCRARASEPAFVIDDPLGSADSVIRLKRGVRADGQSARTDVTVLAVSAPDAVAATLVRCRIHTGRTHQIRVHLASRDLSIVGDRIYGVPPELFLAVLEEGPTEALLAAAGAPRHALHAARIVLPHPDGGELDVSIPMPDDMRSWCDARGLPHM